MAQRIDRVLVHELKSFELSALDLFVYLLIQVGLTRIFNLAVCDQVCPENRGLLEQLNFLLEYAFVVVDHVVLGHVFPVQTLKISSSATFEPVELMR